MEDKSHEKLIKSLLKLKKNKLSRSVVESFVSEFESVAENGRVSKKDFDKILGVLVPRIPTTLEPEVVKAGLCQAFSAFDIDTNGFIDAKEFILGLSTLLQGSVQERLEFAFDQIDTNRDGYLSLDEFTSFFYSFFLASFRTSGIKFSKGAWMGKYLPMVISSFDQMDKNKDGLLSFSEYLEGAKGTVVGGALSQVLETLRAPEIHAEK